MRRAYKEQPDAGRASNRTIAKTSWPAQSPKYIARIESN
jgi:hypothetical protein